MCNRGLSVSGAGMGNSSWCLASWHKYSRRAAILSPETGDKPSTFELSEVGTSLWRTISGFLFVSLNVHKLKFRKERTYCVCKHMKKSRGENFYSTTSLIATNFRALWYHAKIWRSKICGGQHYFLGQHLCHSRRSFKSAEHWHLEFLTNAVVTSPKLHYVHPPQRGLAQKMWHRSDLGHFCINGISAHCSGKVSIDSCWWCT